MVRGGLALPVLALLLVVPWSAAGQSAETRPSRELRFSDPAGDVQLRTPQGNQSAPPGDHDHLDILGGWLGNETLLGIEVGYHVKRIHTSAVAGTSGPGPTVMARFHYGGSNFSAWLLDPNQSQWCKEGGYLQRSTRFVGGGVSSNAFCIRAQTDASAGLVRFFVPRHLLRNETYAVFGPGATLGGFHIESRDRAGDQNFALELLGVRSAPHVGDRAPDVGTPAAYTSVLGEGAGTGSIRLFSRQPIRVSNGESTTIVYKVELTNAGREPAPVTLQVQNPEATWDVRVPARLVVAPTTTVVFPVILSMGFTHRHGETAHFEVEALHQDDPGSRSTIQLGVFWTDSPQPAGHHDTLWVHSGPKTLWPYIGFPVVPGACEFASLWMNPLEKDLDPAAVDEPRTSCNYDGSPSRITSYANNDSTAWSIALKPDLLIGLDFDLSREGRFWTAIRSPFPVPRARLEAQVYYYDPSGVSPGCSSAACQGRNILIGAGQSPVQALAQGGTAPFEVPLMFNAAADLLPFQSESKLTLVARLVGDAPGHVFNVYTSDTAPTLDPKRSRIQFPLIEYHDPVDQAFSAIGTLSLALESDFERGVNPGRTTSFRFNLTNTGTARQAVNLELAGINVDWARFVEGDRLELAPGDSQSLTLLVSVPESAVEGERAELFVIAQARADPNLVAIARLRASVVDAETRDIPDEAGSFEAGEADGTPAPPVGWAVAMVVLAFALARKRSPRR